jgi:tRNA pseudouridine38-40 synthase
VPAPGEDPSRDGALGPDLRPLPGARNLKLVIEYDGACFSGWQSQPGVRTIQGSLERALGVVLRHGVVVRGAGRTDAGVHAWAQVANLYTTAPVDPERLLRSVNGLLPQGVRVRTIGVVPLGFDARRDATGKQYGYRILHRPGPSPLREGRVWHVWGRLDRQVLAAELGTLAGTHDWTSFRATDCTSPTAIKALSGAWMDVEDNDVLVLRFRGEGFLKQMVRVLVGTAVEVARGKRPPGDMRRVLALRDRREAGPTAPAEGLYLERVEYPGEEP